MIIGVDAGALSVTDDRLKVGVYRVVFNLLKELGCLDKKNTYRLYSFLPIEEGILNDLGQSMTNVVLPQKGWFKIWLPLELRRRPPDVFLGLSQALPSFAKRTIGFIYDLGFLHYPKAYPDSLIKLKKQTEDLVKCADHLIVISQAVADDVKKQYKVDSLVSYPGVDARFKQTGEKYNSKNPYFLFVGALKRGKNVPTLLRAFVEFLKTSRKKYDLLLIGGDYWFDPAIVPTNRVKRLGFVPDADLPKYYRGAVALVVPSIWEGFCLPVVEAMACCCPVIASSAGALPEITRSAGILVDPLDTESLANAMRQISTNIALRKTLAGRGKLRAKQFSWSKMAKSITSLYP